MVSTKNQRDLGTCMLCVPLRAGCAFVCAVHDKHMQVTRTSHGLTHRPHATSHSPRSHPVPSSESHRYPPALTKPACAKLSRRLALTLRVHRLPSAERAHELSRTLLRRPPRTCGTDRAQARSERGASARAARPSSGPCGCRAPATRRSPRARMSAPQRL